MQGGINMRSVILGIVFGFYTTSVFAKACYENFYSIATPGIKNLLSYVPRGDQSKFPHFDGFTQADILPAFRIAVDRSWNRIDRELEKQKPVTFNNTIHFLEVSTRSLDTIGGLFGLLRGSLKTPVIASMESEFQKISAEFSHKIFTDERLFRRVEELHGRIAEFAEQEAILIEDTYRSFANSGFGMSKEKQKELFDLKLQLSDFVNKYTDNINAERAEFKYLVAEKELLKGMNETFLKMTFEKAKQQELDGYLITMEPSLLSHIMTNVESDEVKKHLATAIAKIGYGGNQYDNRILINEILQTKQKIAHLLGFQTIADMSMLKKMAKSANSVEDFLMNLLPHYLKKAKADLALIQDFKKERTGDGDLKAWSIGYWSNKYAKEKLKLDSEKVKQYLEFSNVKKGAFYVLDQLYGLKVSKIESLQGYVQGSEVYRVDESSSGQFLGYLILDMYSRPGLKNSGAWMNDVQNAYYDSRGRRVQAISSINMNIVKPSEGEPMLLTLGDARTFFHELGHAIHGLVYKAKYQSKAGVNVEWDGVELPSQFMENFLLDPIILQKFAIHHETGEAMPADLVDKILANQTFNSGLNGLRQIKYGLIDMAYHNIENLKLDSIEMFEKEVVGDLDLVPSIEGGAIGPSFSHIFAGGYTAGYYSYKWAEVLDADAFSIFQSEGTFNPIVAQRFYNELLTRGGSRPLMKSYIEFAGREPDNRALLLRDGIVK